MRGCFSGDGYKSGFESRSLQNVSFEQSVVRAKKVIAQEAVPFDLFEDKYGHDTVRSDKAYVANRNERFARGEKIDDYGTNCAKIFEAILHMRLKKEDWVNGVQAIKTNEFDDIAKGVDEAVRILDPETKKELGAFAIDAMITGGGPLNVTVEKKMQRIHEEILKNELPSVKYFFDPETGALGLERLPRIVVGADTKTIQEINEMWMENNKEGMRAHPLQIQIFEQIIEQAKEIGGFAERNGQIDIAKKYEEIKKWAKKQLAERTKKIDPSWNDNAMFVISNSLFPFKDTKNFKSLEHHHH